MTPGEEHLRWLKEKADELGVAELAGVVLDDPRFATWTGSSGPAKHHFGPGGLAVHTREVAALALRSLEGLPDAGLAPADVFLAAVFHDAGKMDDYLEAGGKTRTGRLVYHVNGSAILWAEAAKRVGYPAGKTEGILHAILAHHGQPEWGSSVKPQTKLAWLLHLSDCLSARWDDVYRDKSLVEIRVD